MKTKLLFLTWIFVYSLSAQVQIGTDIDGELAGDVSGTSISLSSDGSIVAIGAPGHDGNGVDSGRVRVYQYQTDNWVQIGSDIDGEFAGDKSGTSISLSTDGSVVAVGSPGNDGNGVDSGHVRVYEYQTDSWVQIGLNIGGEFAGDESGISISLSSDGSIVAVGSPGNDGNGVDSGHVRVYQYQIDSWVQLGSDIDGEFTGDKSGTRISLSSDGIYVAIGAPFNDGNGADSGHVRVYEYQTNTNSWVQLGQDIDGESVGDESSSSISLSSNGFSIVIGASGNDENGVDSGHVREYEYQTDSWVQQGSDIDGESAGDEFGASVSYGNSIAIGASGNDGNGSDSGRVQVYQAPYEPDWYYNCYSVYDSEGNYLYDDCYWEYYKSSNIKSNTDNWQFLVDIDGETAGDESGTTVSLSYDGNIVAIGSPKNDGNGVDSGHVRVYDLSRPSNDLCASATPIDCGNSLAFDTTGATQENATICDILATSPEVWFTYTETVAQTLVWTTCDDADFDTFIHVFSGSCDALVCVAGNDDGAGCTGFTSTVSIASTIGTTYYIKVSGLGSATGTGNLTMDCSILGLDEFGLNGFEYFPNPVNDNLSIRGQSNIQSVSAYNILGQEVITMAPNTLETEVNMDWLSQGSYFVKVSINDVSQTIRIIKK